MGGLDFDGWDPTDFEEFLFSSSTYSMGLLNVDWRRNTEAREPRLIAADRGRDIVAEVEPPGCAARR